MIALVGLLAGLLLPPLNRAREKSREAVCVGNLRQIGQATVMYCGDFGRLPTASFSGYLMWNGVQYLLYARMVEASGKSLARCFFCPSARAFPMDDPDTGIQNLGIPGKVTAGSYYMRGTLQGAPTTLDTGAKALVADLFESTGVLRNHRGGITVLYSDGSVRFSALPNSWDAADSHAWEQFDRGSIHAGP